MARNSVYTCSFFFLSLFSQVYAYLYLTTILRKPFYPIFFLLSLNKRNLCVCLVFIVYLSLIIGFVTDEDKDNVNMHMNLKK
jgi:hypothetical protein